MRVQTHTPEEDDFAEPASLEPAVAAFAEPLKQLMLALDLAEGERVQEILIDVFTGVFEAPDRFEPSTDPSMRSWFYRQAIRHLPFPDDRKQRKQTLAVLPAILASPPHELTEPEIASALHLREQTVAARIQAQRNSSLASAGNANIKIDPQAITARVRARRSDSGRTAASGRTGGRTAWREGLLAAFTVGAVLLLVFFFMRSGQSGQGVPIFEDEPEPPPAIPLPDNYQVSQAIAEGTEENFFFSLYPALSDDGRYVLFTSNRPDLVPGDLNGALDVFVRDTENGETYRVSLGASGEELDGESFSGAISADGSRVVFLHQRFNGAEVYLNDWQTGESRVISGAPDGQTYAEYLAPGISGDGNTAAFWGASSDRDRSRCTFDESEGPCFDLYIYRVDSGELVHIPFGKAFSDVFLTTELSHDGSLIAMTLTRDDAWQALRGSEFQEAVLYDWALGRFYYLTNAPDGSMGNGPSSWPVMSADALSVAFISEADNLVEGDEPGTPDLFFLDRETGRLDRIELSQQPGLTNSGLVFGASLLGIAISPDGRYVVFSRTAPGADVTDFDSIFCGFLATEWECAATFVYDSLDGSIRQLTLTPILDQIDPFSVQGNLIFLPSVSEGARRIAFQVGSWEMAPACPPDGCLSVWLLSPDQGVAIQAGRPQPAEPGTNDEETWTLSGNIPGPAGWVNAVAFSPDGRWLAAGREDGTIQLTDLAGESEPAILATLPDVVSSVAFDPGGRRLAAGCRDGSVRIWDLESRAIETTLYDHPGIVLSIAFSPDGESLAVGSQQALWIWTDSAAGYYQSAGFAQKAVNAVDYSDNGSFLASVSGNEVWIRDTATGEVYTRLAAHTDRVLDLDFSPAAAGRYLLATTSEDGMAHIWRIGLNHVIEHIIALIHGSWVSSASFSPTGRLLATGSFDSTIYLWDTTRFELIDTLHRSSQDQVLALAFDPSGGLLAGGTVQALRVWKSGSLDFTLPVETRYFRFSSADEFIAAPNYLANWFRFAGVELNEYGAAGPAAEAAGPDFPLLRNVPDDLTLQSIGVYRSTNGDTVGVAQSYIFTTFIGPATITFLQSSIDLKLADWPVVATATVVETRVDGHDAELMTGGWGFEERVLDDGSAVRPWSDEASSLFIRWHDGTWYYSIYYDVPYNTTGLLSPGVDQFDVESLIALAVDEWLED